MSTGVGQTIRPELRSLTYRDGNAVRVRKPPVAKPWRNEIAAHCETHGGHMPHKLGHCVRCGSAC